MRHRFLVHSPHQIDRLRRAGVNRVTIDLTRGSDVTPPDRTAPNSARPGGAHPLAELTSAMTSLPLRDLEQELTSAERAREQLTHTVRRLYAHLQSSGTIDSGEAAEAVREIMIVTRTLTDPAVFWAMSQARHTDPALSTHALVTCTLSLIMGQGIGLGLTDLQDLATGALLHDLGLVGMSRKILARLNNTSRIMPRQDLAIYQAHSREGAIRIERQRRFSHSVRRIVAEHHALPNGRGFPQEADPTATTRMSRIVMIADRYDDLLTGFGGATPLAPHDAIQRLYMESQEQSLDLTLTSLFIKRVGVFPVYSLVVLNTGERAVVTEINEEALHLPVIHVTHNATGQALSLPTRIDLARQDREHPNRSVARVLDSARPKKL
ncbi:c-di-GMP phosphodiesterase [Nitrospira sp.]|nr:c-di-GMP phosphodiesterase [Nitrospira sp.]